MRIKKDVLKGLLETKNWVSWHKDKFMKALRVCYVDEPFSKKKKEIGVYGEYETEAPFAERIWVLEERQKDILLKLDLLLEHFDLELAHREAKDYLKAKDAEV